MQTLEECAAIKAKVKSSSQLGTPRNVQGSGSGEANASLTPDGDATGTLDEQAVHEGVDN